MRSKNAKRLVEFKGEHPILQNGKCYTIAEYVKVCNDSNESEIKYSTLKGRLYGAQYCEPKHLTGTFAFQKNNLGYDRAARERVRTASRLGNSSERLMAKWLRVKL